MTYWKPGLVFIADFEKAFDKVLLEFIYTCLEYFNFGESLIQWVKVMYSNPRCEIENNGYISECFLNCQKEENKVVKKFKLDPTIILRV